jgi:hypothetical protein
MKIGLVVAAVAMMTGCGAATTPRAATPEVGTATLTSATAASSLAPAAWQDRDDDVDPSAAPAAPVLQTWGASALVTPPAP